VVQISVPVIFFNYLSFLFNPVHISISRAQNKSCCDLTYSDRISARSYLADLFVLPFSSLYLHLFLTTSIRPLLYFNNTMTSPSTITQRFLSNPHQLGVVAVGFNGGQVHLL